MNYSEIPKDVLTRFRQGVVIPALPLALNQSRKLDERRQRALMRYYLDAGAGGVAVAVHTTQFEIRLPKIGLFEPVLEIAREEFDSFQHRTQKPVIRIAGVIGRTEQAVAEARLALKNGFHAVLLSVAAFAEDSNFAILEHCRAVAEVIPVIGFYLQPAVGGRKLDVEFWREFARIENVIAIKMAPFNRYHTLDVVRGVVESGRADQVALYTGNDDNIVVDLLSEYQIPVDSTIHAKRVVGGLLGHWAVWTHAAVNLLESVQAGKLDRDVKEALVLAHEVTDTNAAFFDVAHNFAGCIVGLHEVLRRQGLLEGIWTLDEREVLSPSQKAEIDRVYAVYPHLNDDEFVAQNRDKWLS
ncbi:dihydrodipicolinate synthase family protein [Maribellus sp. CM-23]|uniref:dihydrodipicolinate synthase family protein n=1 Tax=Maribellus sp. CM-23 TaxID=2781026 RepID=UPI001F2FDD08|nr:dihydrodipicolinate synthase family protein [Maribellus sp. CM-23]MCE4567023.1 dihydrodipicolinate synthase family protein [Maribellus sp. CM-23]